VQAMTEHFGAEGLNEGRRRMSRVPQGSRLIRCEKTIAPGAHIGNVYILAGVPYIFESQIDSILHQFGDRPYQRIEIEVELAESLFARPLTRLQERHADIEIGSYPGRCGPNPCGKICLSGQDAERLQQAVNDVEKMLAELIAG